MPLERASAGRQLGHDTLESAALAPIGTLADSAFQTDLKAYREEVRKAAEEQGIQLP